MITRRVWRTIRTFTCPKVRVPGRIFVVIESVVDVLRNEKGRVLRR
jgi:hypothetical protein